MGARRRDVKELGGRPRYPLVFSGHAFKRFAERFALTNDVQAELEEIGRRATWAGKTEDGAYILRSGHIDLLVSRWEYKYRVMTVRDTMPGSRILPLNADCGPQNPPHYARRSK
ncbi:MAG TPA: hypothetical protein VFA98_10520 [Thermoanaerobaculia bacterium]|nr:hypothetical protein [Thermoanaerobaculia bacterium]